jgi:hypothetical protein
MEIENGWMLRGMMELHVDGDTEAKLNRCRTKSR